MSKNVKFNGKKVTELIRNHNELWRKLVNDLWGDGRQQSKDYFSSRESVSCETLYIIAKTFGLCMEDLIIVDGEEKPQTIDQHVHVHHSRIGTFNANTDPNILVQTINFINGQLETKDQLIKLLQEQVQQKDRDLIRVLEKFPNCIKE